MSELAVAEPAEAIKIAPEVPVGDQAAGEPTGVALADLLVEEVSIDGMCGVY